MDTPTLKRLTELHDRLAVMARELRSLQENESITRDNRAMSLYMENSRGATPYIDKIPQLKEKVFNIVLSEYAKEYNRLFKEYDELTICKPNGKITTFKPIDVNNDLK